MEERLMFQGLDEYDNAILRIIKDNARMSYSDIGALVGLSRPAVKNRMDAMVKKGIIQGFRTDINTFRITEGVRFVIDVEVTTENYQDVLETLCNDPYIRQVYGTTGNCRLHCQGFAPNNSTLDSHVRYLYNHNKGIRRLEWHMLVTTFKDKDGGVDYGKEMSRDI